MALAIFSKVPLVPPVAAEKTHPSHLALCSEQFSWTIPKQELLTVVELLALEAFYCQRYLKEITGGCWNRPESPCERRRHTVDLAGALFYVGKDML